MHTLRVREIDRPPPPEFSSPVRMASEIDHTSEAVSASPTPHYGEGSASPIAADYEGRRYHDDWSQSSPYHQPTVPDEPPDDPLMSSGVFDVHPRRLGGSWYDLATVHGPALADDSPDQLYDDWGGEVSNEEQASGEHFPDADDVEDSLGIPDGGDAEDEWDGYEQAELDSVLEEAQILGIHNEDLLSHLGMSSTICAEEQIGEGACKVVVV